MKNLFCLLLISFFLCFSFISCNSDFERDEHSRNSSWKKVGNPDAWFTSNANNDGTIAFGESFRHQITTGGTSSSNFRYSITQEPWGMNISSTGLVVWTPALASQIKKHKGIKLSITLPSGYVISQKFDLTVTGTCTSGNALSIWSGDQRGSTNNSKILGTVIAYTDNSSSVKTAEENYNLTNNSVSLTHGPTPTATTGNVFFYNQYNNTSQVYLFWMFGVKGNSQANDVKLDVFTDGNTSTDAVVVTDDANETTKESSGCGSSDACYKGRYDYSSSNSDGAVIGPFTGSSYRIFINKGGTSTIDGSSTLTVGGLNSFKFYSKDGESFALGNIDSFTVGFGSSFDCNN